MLNEGFGVAKKGVARFAKQSLKLVGDSVERQGAV
jgi:hypothetical protein